MAAERYSALPPSLAPRGLSRPQAAEYIGVGCSKFDEMVQDGRMPKPKRIDSTRYPYRGEFNYEGTVWVAQTQGFSHSAPLALCIAALKARAAP